MKLPLTNWVQSLRKLSDIRYEAEKQFLETLDKSKLDFGNEFMRDSIQSSLSLGRVLMDSRYQIEKSFLDSMDINGETAVEESAEGEGAKAKRASQAKAISPLEFQGVFHFTAAAGQKIEFPLNINNNFNEEQEVKVVVSGITGDNAVLRTKFKVDPAKVHLPPSGKSKVKLSLNLGAKSFVDGNDYHAELSVIGKEEKKFKIVIHVNNKSEKPTFRYAKS